MEALSWSSLLFVIIPLLIGAVFTFWQQKFSDSRQANQRATEEEQRWNREKER